MSSRTSIYNFLYSKVGDKWYPGFDYENMLTVENQLEALYKFVGPGVISGWTIEKLSDLRSDQLSLINDYVNDPYSHSGQIIKQMNLEFTVECAVVTSSNITLSGGAPLIVDGITLQNDNLVLVKNQTTALENGIYKVDNSGVALDGTWVRHESLLQSSDYTDNFVVYITNGTDHSQTIWIGAVNSSGFILDTTSLYFEDAFSQCVKVNVGSGIISKFSAQTSLPYYFRYTRNERYYIWAIPAPGLQKDGNCEIISPLDANSDYGNYHTSIYLGEAVSTSNPTYNNINYIEKIVYSYRRNDLNDALGSYQNYAKRSFIKHKHLGEIGTPSKVNLSDKIVLVGSTVYNGDSSPYSTTFVIKNQDGTLYGNDILTTDYPEVRIDNQVLSSDLYKIDSSDTIKKLYLRNSIESTSIVEIILSVNSVKKLFVIDTNYNRISGIGLTYGSKYVLSDGTAIGSSSGYFDKFVWSNAFYTDPKVYLGSGLILPKYYSVNSNSGFITFNSTLPSYSNYNVSDISIILNSTKSEIQNSLPGSKISSIGASSFTKGLLSQSRLDNLQHNRDIRYKKPCTFTYTKNLIPGFGSSYYYPVNTSSDLQYNTEINFINQSLNFTQSLVVGTTRGLMVCDDTMTGLKKVSSYKNDYGRLKSFMDDIVIPLSINHNGNSYALTYEGLIFRYSSSNKTWIDVKSPFKDSQKLPINSFYISGNYNIANTGSTYSSYIYAATNSGIYDAQINDASNDNTWNWYQIQSIYDISGDSVSPNIPFNNILEVSSKNTEIVVNEQDIVTVDRKIYATSNDATYEGLFFGDADSLSQLFTDQINGLYWIKNGAYKNNILFWTDYDLFITHTARYVESTSGSYWELPFTVEAGSYTQCSIATTENITLSGLSSVIDGNSVLNNYRVLVKNQTDPTENGIYVASSGAWTRASDFDSSSEIVYGKQVYVVFGDTFGGSSWFVKYQESYTLGTTDIEWDIYRLKIYSTYTTSYSNERTKILCAEYRESDTNLDQYLIGMTEGLFLITDGKEPSWQELFWEAPLQGQVKSIFTKKTSSVNGTVYVGSDRGVYVNTERLWLDINNVADLSIFQDAWARTENEFLSTDEFSVYDFNSNLQETNYSTSSNYQIVKFNDAKSVGTNYVYSREYSEFYTDPWEDTYTDASGNLVRTNVVVYINDVPTSTPFYTNSTTGLIKFTSSLKLVDLDNVTISISKENPFVSNVGIKPHAESIAYLKKSNNPIALLARENTPSQAVLYLNQKISSALSNLLLYSGAESEIVSVMSIDNNKIPVEVTLKYSRLASSSNKIFNSSTEIYAISDELISGIEDDLSKIKNQRPYAYLSNSVNNNNLLALQINENIAGIFTNSSLTNLNLYNNFENIAEYDLFISDGNTKTSLEPTANDSCLDPSILYKGLDFSTDGLDSYVVTDFGVWKFSYRWDLMDLLDNSERAHYIKRDIDGNIKVGTELGLFEFKNDAWTKNPNYTQEQFDYIYGTWGSDKFEAYAKSDGISFVKFDTANSTFTSDHLSNLEGQKVYGIYKDKFHDISTNSELDILLAFADNGIYGCSTATNTSIFNSFLNGREMLGSNKPSDITKYYNAFRAQPIPTIPASNNSSTPLFVLTDNGLLKIRNWYVCNPGNNINYKIESRFLLGSDCKCFATSIIDSEDGIKPGNSVIIIGTDNGIYRSFDEGNTFEPADKYDGNTIVARDIQLFTSDQTAIPKTIFSVLSNYGILYSDDYGDNWYKSRYPTRDDNYLMSPDHLVNNNINLSDQPSEPGYVAQTFVTNPNETKIIKASAYLGVSPQVSFEYQNSLDNNTIRAYLYSVGSNDTPDILLDTSPTYYVPNDLLNNENFFNFEFDYDIVYPGEKLALVIQEIITAGGISVVHWKKSTYRNSYLDGNLIVFPFEEILYDVNYDLYFKIHYDSQPTETITPEAVGNYDGAINGWEDGRISNLIVLDDGSLTLDIKFMVAMILDNSYSMNSNVSNYNYKTKLKLFIDRLYDRTDKTVGADTLQTTAFSTWNLDSILMQQSSNVPIASRSSVKTIIDNLDYTGTDSPLNEALDLSIVSLNYQSITDLNIIENDETNNIARISLIRDYLESISGLRLSDIQSRYSNESSEQTWDLSSSTVQLNSNARSYLLDSWAKSYCPILLCVVDGDNTSSESMLDLIRSLELSWNELGSKAIVFALGNVCEESSLIEICKMSGGYFYKLTNDSEWNDAISSLSHDGNNSLFKGSWSKEFKYDTPEYIKSVYSTYNTPLSSSLTIEYRYSIDNENFTQWTSVVSGVDSVIEKFVTEIQYRIAMEQGWDGSLINPVIYTLYHNIVIPAEKTLFTSVVEVTDVINEYNLSSYNTNESKVNLEFYFSQSELSNLLYFDKLNIGKNSLLKYRQKSIDYTKEITYNNLTSIAFDSQYNFYQIKNGNENFTWNSSGIVTVYINGNVVNITEYKYNNTTGTIRFNSSNTSLDIVTAKVVIPSERYYADGEATISDNQLSYYFTNGTVAPDHQVVILKNNEIIRSGYTIDKQCGKVVFDKYQLSTDVIKAAVLPANYYRLAVKIYSYDTSVTPIYNFGLQHTKVPRSVVGAKYYSTNQPYIADNKISLSSANRSSELDPSVNYRSYLDYTFVSSQNVAENKTNINWYLVRASQTYPLNGLDATINYGNKHVLGKYDLANFFLPGDQIYATVTPYDGFKLGIPYTSNTFEFTSLLKPYCKSVQIKSSAVISNNQISSNNELTAYYLFIDSNNATDQSFITWYDLNAESKVLTTSKTLSSDLVMSGMAICFVVTPYNGIEFGSPIQSSIVYVN